MLHNTLAETRLAEHTIYKFGNLLLEATYFQGWTLMVVTENGYHVTRKHGALVAFKLRPDGLWDTLYDCETRNFFGWKRWRIVAGKPQAIEAYDLQPHAPNRNEVKQGAQERDTDRKFREIMAAMAW
jgi:hypothetical protein